MPITFIDISSSGIFVSQAMKLFSIFLPSVNQKEGK